MLSDKIKLHSSERSHHKVHGSYYVLCTVDTTTQIIYRIYLYYSYVFCIVNTAKQIFTSLPVSPTLYTFINFKHFPTLVSRPASKSSSALFSTEEEHRQINFPSWNPSTPRPSSSTTDTSCPLPTRRVQQISARARPVRSTSPRICPSHSFHFCSTSSTSSRRFEMVIAVDTQRVR